MPDDHLPGAGAIQTGQEPRPHDAKPFAALRRPLPGSPTEKMRAFLRSGRYKASEILDVYSGEFKFMPLGDTETADMRHQKERRRHTPVAVDQGASTAPPPHALQNDGFGADADADVGCVNCGTPFVSLAPNLCLHRHGRHEGCRNCIDVCSGGAIQAVGLTPHLDPAACLGCGLCTSACPSGALQWRDSGPGAWLHRLRCEMSALTDRGVSPWVVFQEKPASSEQLPAESLQVVRIEVPTPGVLAMDIFLTAMALGAAGVMVLTSSERLDLLRPQLEREIRWTRAVLQAAGVSGADIRLQDADGTPSDLAESKAGSAIRPAQYPFDRPKREMISQAVAHLLVHAGSRSAAGRLPLGAPFGGVYLDGAKCTLCMACAGACKMNALQALGGEAPGLQFQEKHCVQCGLCARVCPEQALTLIPRIDPEAYGMRSLRILHQVQPARCSACGAVFASQRMIDAIRDKLQGHWMYADPAAQRRLSMCDRCRVQDFFFNSSSASE